MSEAYPTTPSPLGNKKPLEKNVFIETTSEAHVILEDLRIPSSKESIYNETNAADEEKVLNLSSLESTNVHQYVIPMTSPSIHHKTNSSVENNLRININSSSSPFPDIRMSSSKGYSYGETEEKSISNPSTQVTMKVHHTQRFIAMSSPSIPHKINSTAPPSTENSFLLSTVNLTASSSPSPQVVSRRIKTVTKGLVTTTIHSDNTYTIEVSNTPVTKDYVIMEYVLTQSTSNHSVCNYSEYNSTLNKANISMNALKKEYFNTDYHRNELEILCARAKYLSNCLNNNHSDWKVLQKDYRRFQEDYYTFQKELCIWKIVLKYIDPVLYAIIITMGVGGNGMLVIIFVRHPVILTSPNIVVFIIAVCDILALLIIAPLDYVTEFYGGNLIGDIGCKMYIYIRLVIRSITELCLVILSGQRFLSTISLGRRGTLKARLASRRFIWMLMISVWLVSSVFCVPTFFVIKFTDGTCFPHIKHNTLPQLFFFFIITFFVILPLPMVVFNGLTALRLGSTTREDFPHTRRSRLILPRYRSARVIAILAIFYACAFPRTLWVAFVCWGHLNRRSALYFSIDQLINFMYFADSCSMPFILFFLSSVYRKLFRQFWQYEYYRVVIKTTKETAL